MEVIPEPRIRFFKWIRKYFAFTFSIMTLISVLIVLGLLYLRSQPLPPVVIQENTTIYSADGQVIDMIYHEQNRIYVPIEQIPEYLLQAIIAVEDQRFYQHLGIDFKRIIGAAIVNVKNQGLMEGASTITQQLAKNLYLTSEKTWQRKFVEALYAIQLELHYSKTEILERYLNQIYFGHSAYGVEAASQLFFGKKVSELTLAESAMLVGIPKGPGYFSPWISMEHAKSRQELILLLMEQNGYITNKERINALAQELVILDPSIQRDRSKDKAPYFSDYIRQLVINEYGIEEEVFEHGGLRIYTTLDLSMQEEAIEVMKEYIPFDRDLQGALMAMDPKSGYIKAMIGGKDYAQSQYNRVFADRQPGSAIKPYLYYSALEHGWTPLSSVKSERTTFIYDEGRKTYTPQNFNDVYPNDVITMEQAIAESDNIYAVKTLMSLGEQTLVDTLHRFGINRSFRPLPSLALGAQSLSLFEMVRGYAAFANLGTLPKPIAILRIEDRLGNLIAEQQPESVEILDPGYTFVLNQMMDSVFEPGGTGYRISSTLRRPVAGKTGSTDTDSWMVGYTPQLVAGVWIGYDQGELMNHSNDGQIAGQIWADFLESALAEDVVALFPEPDGVIGVSINPESSLLSNEHCPEERLVYFKKGTEPTEYCHDHPSQSLNKEKS